MSTTSTSSAFYFPLCTTRSAVAIKSAVDAWDVLQCSKAVAKYGLHQTVKVACSLVGSTGSIICYQKSVANGCEWCIYLSVVNAQELQVMEMFVGSC